MSDFQIVKQIFSDPSGEAGDISVIGNGLHLWSVTIRAGLDESVCIGHTADLHFNWCDEQDLAEADPVLMSTLEHRRWLAGGSSVENAARSLAFLNDTTDQVVVNGDTLDYQSHGAMGLMRREVWDKYPGILATVGGHELTRRMEGTVPETLPQAVLYDRLERFWRHDIYYASKLVKGRVLVVTVLNDGARFNAQQVKKFSEDLESARANGYVVLLFGHEPFRTNVPEDRSVGVEDILIRGDLSGFPMDLCDFGPDDEDTRAFNALIAQNADLIRGVFSGHLHDSLFRRIAGRTKDGAPASIPHFILTTNACDKGHVMRITVE